MRPVKTKGKIPPISKPVKISGSVREIELYASGVSKCELLKKPPKRVILRRATQPTLIERLTNKLLDP